MNTNELIDIDNIKWLKVGYFSVFDHWLNDVEADNCNYLCYSLAKSSGSLNLYLKGEENFIKFYTSLSSEAWCFYNGSWNFISTDSDDFKIIIKNSLREKDIKFFDIFYADYSLRVKGGFDRTDQFFISDLKFLSKLEKNVQENNLYILGMQDY